LRHKVFNRHGVLCRLPYDGLHHAQQIFGAMRDFSRKNLQFVFMLLALRDILDDNVN
jgi:hypothetical protein